MAAGKRVWSRRLQVPIARRARSLRHRVRLRPRRRDRLVNPEIVVASPEREEFEEGCLSMPGAYAVVERAAAVTVRAFDTTGAPLEIDAEGRHASVLQHEIDHLDGILIPDRLARPERRRYLAELRAAFSAGRMTGPTARLPAGPSNRATHGGDPTCVLFKPSFRPPVADT
jgi:peptide deformylase